MAHSSVKQPLSGGGFTQNICGPAEDIYQPAPTDSPTEIQAPTTAFEPAAAPLAVSG
jgi:hypothetical protein